MQRTTSSLHGMPEPDTRSTLLDSRLSHTGSWLQGLILQRSISCARVRREFGSKFTSTKLSEPGRSYRRAAAIASPSDPEGTKQVIGYGIASVFTPPEKRRKGYAQHMMRLLHWVLAPRHALPPFPEAWGAPPEVPPEFGVQNAQFSVLYSDVGKEFYRACGPTAEQGNGWLTRGAIETSWYAAKASADTSSESTAPHIWLSEDDAKHVWSLDVPLMSTDLAKAAASTSRTTFSFLPHKGVGAFVVQRTMTFKEDKTPVLPLDTWGVLLLPNSVVGVDEVFADPEKQPTYATWTVDSSAEFERFLVVTRLRASKETLPALLKLVVQFAVKEEIPKIEIWGLSEELQGAAREHRWETADRAEHLSAFKWYGKENEDDLLWMFNEKYVRSTCSQTSRADKDLQILLVLNMI